MKCRLPIIGTWIVFMLCVGTGAVCLLWMLTFPLPWRCTPEDVGRAGLLAEWMTCLLTVFAIATAYIAFRDERSHRRNEEQRNFQETLLQLATTFYSSASARQVRIALDGRKPNSEEYAKLMGVIKKNLGDTSHENTLTRDEWQRLAEFDEYLNFFNSVAIIASEKQAGDGKEARFAETRKHFDYYLKQLEGDSTDKTILEYATKHGFEDLVRLLEGTGTLKKAPQ